MLVVLPLEYVCLTQFCGAKCAITGIWAWVLFMCAHLKPFQWLGRRLQGARGSILDLMYPPAACISYALVQPTVGTVDGTMCAAAPPRDTC